MRKKPAFLLLLLFLVAFCIWRVFHFPYHDDLLYRAMPAGVTAASEHVDLAGRWGLLGGNPVLQATARSAGMTHESIADLRRDPAVRRLLNIVAERKTVLGLLPSSTDPASPGPAWFCASWVGGRAQWLRWGLLSRSMGSGCRKIHFAPGVSIWSVPVSTEGAPRFLSASLVDGVLLLALSRDSHAVRLGVRRLRAGADVAPEFAPDADASFPDRGWFRFAADSAFPLRAPGVVRFGARPGRRTLTVQFRRNAAPGPSEPAPMQDLLDALPRTLPLAPTALLIARTGQAMAVMAARAGERRALSDALRDHTDPDGAFFTCMLDRENSGQVMGLRVPALLAGVQVREDHAPLLTVVSSALDVVNAHSPVKLIPQPSGQGADAPIRIRSAGEGGMYGSLRQGEWPAVVLVDRWLLFCSSENALLRLLAARGRGGQDWAAPLRSTPTVPAAWASLGGASRSLRDALAVYTLALIAGGEADTATRAQLETAKHWLAEIDELGESLLWVERQGKDLCLEIRVGDAGLPADK